MTKKKGHSAPKRELRSHATPQPLTIRSTPDGKQIAGTAVVYNQLSQDLGGGWFEKIAPGAFTKSLRNKQLDLILFNHDTGQVLGRVSAGTATVTDSPAGLRFTCKLGNTSFANDLADMLQRGDVSACSFGFNCVKDSWDEVNGLIVRTVEEAEIFECSVVSTPAYLQTSVNLRSLPASLRSKIAARDEDEDCDPDTDDDCEDDEDRDMETCSCDCSGCSGGLDCSECGNADCADVACLRGGCTSMGQDANRADKLRVRRLFQHRMRLT